MSTTCKIEIRAASLADHDLCAGIYGKAWNLAFPSMQRTISVADFKREIDGELVLLAAIDSSVTGYISVWQPDWFVHHLYVDPGFHGLGVGRTLVDHLLGLASPKSISLKCQLANFGAMAFYERLGFVRSDDLGSDEYGDWVRLVKGHN